MLLWVLYVEHGRGKRACVRGGALWLCLLALVPFSAEWGCSRGELRIEDTEGQIYTAACRDYKCRLTLASAAPSEKETYELASGGRIVGVCKRIGGMGTPRLCRPLACKTDGNCPATYGLQHGTCINALCTEPDRPIRFGDAVLLCLAGTGWGRDSPVQVDRYALAANCGTPCRIPAPCRQP